MIYLAKIPGVVTKIFKERIWQMPDAEKKIYITFDDGPHPLITPFVLNELKKVNAKATFFCIGKNVAAYPEIYRQIILEGHSTGNHTYNHLNGWKTDDDIYIKDINEAKKLIESNLFRPPYGRIKNAQLQKIQINFPNLNTIMWTVLSGDFDPKIANEKCYQNVIRNTTNGSIIVFHDSEKAFEKVSYTLPKILLYFKEEGFSFEKIDI